LCKLPVTIVDVRSHGTLLVLGETRVLLSKDDEWVWVPEINRPADPNAGTLAACSQFLAARVGHAGHGLLGRASRESWLSKDLSVASFLRGGQKWKA
jgi:flagellar basal body L-ring protein FlgH